MNPTLRTVDGRGVLRFERRLAHPVAKVWRAVSDPAHLRHWFPATVEMDPRAGGAMRFTFPGGQLKPTDGVITELDPPRVFAFTWNGEPLRIELTPERVGGSEGTLLVFTHTFTDLPMAGSFATGWETCLDTLQHALDAPSATGPPGPPESPGPPGPPAGYAERHDAHLAAFGLGEGTVEDGTDDDPGGFTIRFERLLPHPPEHVWAQLTEDSTPVAGGTPPPRVTNEHVEAGPLTEVREREVLEYGWLPGSAPAGRVRWELDGGHPAGTRVVITHGGPARCSGERPRLLAAWHTHLELLAGHLRGATRPWPREHAAELEERYAGRAEAR